MKTEQVNQLLLAACEAERAAVGAHRQLAGACQQAQEAVKALWLQRLGHGREWHVNSRTWVLAHAEVWLTARIEFDEPTLHTRLVLRPVDDEPWTTLRLECWQRLTDIDLREAPVTDITLPCTMPMNQPVRLHLHRRARAWKVYPEVNSNELHEPRKLQQPL